MKEVRFNEEKNKALKALRGIDFDDVAEVIKKSKYVKTVENPNKSRYPNQKIFLVKINQHIYAIPFIEENTYIFLKTVYPSEKYTKKYYKFRKK